MNQRSAAILEAVVEEFINTGEPVSSAMLYENYDFGIKPAMIRLELEALHESGFLEQPHHSAGRAPTDKGYEFFAERALGRQSDHGVGNGGIKDLFLKRAWHDFLLEFPSELGLLGVVADLANNTVYKMGLENLVEHLDWEDRGEISSVIRDFEGMDECVPRVTKKIGNGPKVFIGKKSPVTKSKNLSVVGGNYKICGEEVTILAIGSKRMDYKKTIKIFRSL
jgi:transcriptional regulator of heat shock response